MGSADSDDIFMRSMIKKYAVEERTDSETLDDGTKIGGEPTGKFWMTKSTTLGEDIIMKGKPFHYEQKPANDKLFATGMNGDEDLGEDIIMKGKPFHYNQQ